MIVTLDGPAGVGKTTLAKKLAQALGCAYLDTGAMFRAVAFMLGPDAWEMPENDLAQALQDIRFSLEGSGEATQLLVNGRGVSDEIRTEAVGMRASKLATLPVVRRFLKTAQQKLGRETSLVAEGRDMGSVVFPLAEYKFFLEASPEERGRRRYKQLLQMGTPADLDRITEQIRLRDEQDRNRAAAPLKPADDAVIIDNTELDADQVFERIMDVIRAES